MCDGLKFGKHEVLIGLIANRESKIRLLQVGENWGLAMSTVKQQTMTATISI